MTVQIAPPVAAASSSASSTSAKQDPAKAKTQPKSPSDTSLAQTQAPTEVPSLSTAYSNSYDNHDGTYTASVSATPINYRPTTGGAWAPIDLTLSAISGGNGRLRAAKTGAPVEVGSPDDAAGFVSLDTTAGKISLSLAPGAKPGRSGSKPVSGTNRADVAGLLPGVDLRVVPSSDGFRVFLVLASNPAKPSFTFTLNSPGMTPALQADGSISFTDKTGNLIASMPQPYATDSTVDQSGGGRYTNKVSYALATTGGRNLLTVNVDPSWLASAVYPVYVDPTVATVSGTTNAKDTFVDYAWPASNFKDAVNGSVHEFVIGYDGNTPNPDLPNNKEVCYGLLSFAMPTDAIGSTIDSASLAVYTYYGWVTTAKTVYFDRITSTWSSTSVTWNSKPSYTNLGSAELAPGDTSAFDVKSTVQSWADGAANYGFQLRASDTNDTYWKRLDSSEQNGVHIPKLTITYSRPSATPSNPINNAWVGGPNASLNWSYNSNGGSGNQSIYEVQIATDSGFTNVVKDSGEVGAPGGSVNSYAIPPGVLTDGTSYYYRVQVYDGTSWSPLVSPVGQFRWDATIPTWNGFSNVPTTAPAETPTQPYLFSWPAATDTRSPIAGYDYQLWFAPLASTNLCSANWESTGRPSGWQTTTSYQAPLSTSGCYKLLVSPYDQFSLGGSSTSNPANTSYHSSYLILYDGTNPLPAPSVAASGTGVYQPGGPAAGNTTIYYRSDQATTISLSATGTDTISGIASSTFGAATSGTTTGWQYGTTPVAANSGGTSSENLTIPAGDGVNTVTIPVTTTSNAASSSLTATTLTLVPDTTAPTVGTFGITSDTIPQRSFTQGGAMAYQAGSSATVSWMESDVTGIGTRSIIRYQASVDPANPGVCAGLTYTSGSDSGSIGVNNGRVTLATTGLASGSCYYWTISDTDNLGITGAGTSGYLLVDTSAPAAGPTVTAAGTGVYQSSTGVVYVNGTTGGTLGLTSTASGSGTLAGIGSSTFGSLQNPPGWTFTDPTTIAGNPASINLPWVTSPDSTTLQVNANSKSGVAGPPTTVQINSDTAATAPVGQFLTPAANSLTRQNSTSYNLTWTENAGSGPGIASRTLLRQKATPVTAGTCVGVSWGDDVTTTDTSGVTVSGLPDTTATCYRWKLTLTDSLGISSFTFSGSVLVDTTVPQAYLWIPNPAAGQPISGTVQVHGSATDADLKDWTLDYGLGAAPTSWSPPLASSTSPVTDTVLGTWTTGSTIGVYTIRLTVTDTVGNTTITSSTIYVDNSDRSAIQTSSVPFDMGGGWNLGVNVATGNASLGRTLFDIPGAGPDQSLSLTYNSTDAHNGDPQKSLFGSGWSSNITQYLDLSNASVGFVVWHEADGTEVPFGLIDGVWVAQAGNFETLMASGSGYKITYTDLSSLSFDGTGRLTAITNRYLGTYSQSLAIAWTTSGATISAATGSTRVSFNAKGQIGTITDSAGGVWSFTYTYPTGGGASLASMTDAGGNETDFTLSTAGSCTGYAGSCLQIGRNLTTVNSDGSKTTSTVNWTVGYDTLGRVASVANLAQSATSATTFAYGDAYASGSTTEITAGDSVSAAPALTTTFNLTPDAQGRVNSLVESWTTADQPYSWATTYTYFPDGELESSVRQIDAAGHTSTKSYTYNGAGEVATETDPLTATTSYTTTYTYDTDNNLQTETVAGNSTAKPISIETAYFYDFAGRLSCKVENLTVDPTKSGVTCDADHGPRGIPTAGADSNLVTLYAYDASNDLISQTDPTGVVTRYGYNSVGQKTLTTQNYRTSGTIDDTSIDATNVVTTYGLDAAGSLTSEIDPISQRPTATSTTIATTTPTTSTVETRFTYNAAGELVTKFTPSDAWMPATETAITYDQFGDQTTQTTCSPAGGAAVSVSDCSAGVGSTWLSSTITTDDGLGRATTITDTTAGPNGASATTTTTKTSYDLAGNAYSTTATDGQVTASSFDGLGRLTKNTTAGAETDYAYDGLGDQTRIVAPAYGGGTTTTTSTFNPSGSIDTKTDAATGTTTFIYDAIGRQIGATDASGLTISSSLYDALGRVTSATETNTVTALDGTTSKVTTTVDTKFDFDGRVISVTEPYQAGQPQILDTTAYDPLGRAVSVTTNYVAAGSSDPTANQTSATYYDEAGHPVATVDPTGVVNRSVYSVGGQLAETIKNCTHSGTARPADTGTGASAFAIATCDGLGQSDGSTNLTTKSSAATGSGEITSTQTTGTITTTATYDGEGRILKSVVDPNGLNIETDYAYDASGRKIATAAPAPSGTGRVVNITVYDPATGRVSDTIANCQLSTSEISAGTPWYDCSGSSGQDGAHNLITTLHYDTAGNLLSQKSPTGAITSYTYDQGGRVTSVTANGATSAYYYNSAGQKIAVANPDNVLSGDGVTYSYTVTRYAYDSTGNLIAQLTNCTTTGATPPSDTTATPNAIETCAGGGTKDAATNVLTSYSYDASGHLIAKTAPSPADTGANTATVTTDYAYNANNALCRELENATVDLSSLTYPCTDSLPKGTPIGTSENVSTSYTYTANGELASSVQAADQSSGSSTATTTYAYDGAGQLKSETDPNGYVPAALAAQHTTTFTYDANGNQASETDPDTSGGATIVWLYDAAGRQCRRLVAPINSAITSTNLATLTTPCPSGTTLGTSETFAAIDTQYTYDNAGNLASATDALTSQVIASSYDTDNRVDGVTDTNVPGGISDPGTTYQYGATSIEGLTNVGRTDPSGSYTITFNRVGQQVAMSNPLSGGTGDAYSWTYGPTGAPTSEVEPLGASGNTHLNTAYTYDQLGDLLTKTYTSSVSGVTSGTPAANAYTYNAAGAELTGSSTVSGDTTNNGTSSYAYDPLGRLVQASIPASQATTYGWNATPDRSSVQKGSNSANKVTTYFTAASQPSSDSTGNSYSSNSEGRLTAAPNQTLTWDNLGRLTQSTVLSHGDFVTAAYKYDPLDRLLSVTSGDSVTTYLYVGLTHAIAETIVGSVATQHLTDSSGAVIADISYDSGSRSLVPSYLGTNAHDDVAFATDASGAVNATADYDPFGVLVAHTGTLSERGWQSSLFDPYSALYYAIARWYAPNLGAFVSVDPKAGQLSDPQSLDRYAYIAGNPLGGVDPLGTCDFDTITMSCIASYAGDLTANDSFNQHLEAANKAGIKAAAAKAAKAKQTAATNKCLLTNFHASGCTATTVGKVVTLGTYVSATIETSASPDLQEANDYIVQQANDAKAAEKAKHDELDRETALDNAEDAWNKAHAPKPTPGCSWNPFDSNSCEGQAANFAVQHPWVILGAATAAVLIGTCALATGGVCMAAVLGAAGGGLLNGGLYVGSHLNNFSADDFLTQTTTGTLIGAIGGGLGEQISVSAQAVGATRAAAFSQSVTDSGLPGFIQRPLTSLGTTVITGGAAIAGATFKAVTTADAFMADSMAVKFENGQPLDVTAADGASGACGAVSGFGWPGAIASNVCAAGASLLP
jgi:RHS repeat-associated protein